MFAFIRLQQVESQTVQELSNALAQIWQEIPQDTICHLIRSMLRYCQACIQAFFYFFIFYISVLPLNSALCRMIIFISIKQFGILSFLNHYPVHTSIDTHYDFFFPLRCDVFFKVFF